jgi:hypothetical protein
VSYLRVKMGGMKYGYARVSTDDQNPALQQGILGRDVGKASEALRMPKGGAMDRPSRKRWPKARTRRRGQ